MTHSLNLPRQYTSSQIRTPLLARGVDLIIAGLGLFTLAPLFLVVGLLIKLTSGHPVFYKVERVGQGGRLFKLYKFRSMVVDAKGKQPGITLRDDPRITPVGRFLRRTKLDELPQLLNVLRGDMSLVGPRPEDPRYTALYTPEQRQVLAVRPGLTSPASLHYQEEETLLHRNNWEAIYREQILPHKLALDLAYLQQRTVWTDLALIVKTIVTVIPLRDCLSLILRLRNRHVFLLDMFALLITPAAALTLRLDGLNWWPQMDQALIFFTLVALLVKLLTSYKLDLYNRYWRYAGVNDLTLVVVAGGLSTAILTILFAGAHDILNQYGLAMYRTVPLIDGLLTGLMTGGFRFGLRGLYHWQQRHRRTVGGRRVLIVGAGEAGTMAVREMWANPQLGMEPVAFVDDDPTKIGTHVQGCLVLGSNEDIPKLVEQYQIQRIIVALPSAPLGQLQKIITTCEQTGIATDTLPGVYELLAGSKTISHLPKLDINRLLQREPVVINQTEVAAYLKDTTVLVTGAGGSIGSELCRQIARLGPQKIILLGHGENSIFEIALDLRLSFPNLITQTAIVDIRDQKSVDWVVEKYQPQVIFHAAAHKHVNLMETCVTEAITNNVLGTQNVLRAAEQYGVNRFVLISTDKAINPTAIMGATKRIAELLVVAAARRSGRAYLAVRFGNVLGSRGSAIHVFQRQIAAGGPLTITHPDMCRYFMTIPEAVQLVLQATVLGQGGDILTLDMGNPVQILDLATTLIKLSGLEPDRDIKIVYTGIRPGEKLREELFPVSEAYRPTKHQQILVAQNGSILEAEILEQTVTRLIDLARQMQTQAALEQIRAIVPQYQRQSRLPKPTLIPETVVSGSLHLLPALAGS